MLTPNATPAYLAQPITQPTTALASTAIYPTSPTTNTSPTTQREVLFNTSTATPFPMRTDADQQRFARPGLTAVSFAGEQYGWIADHETLFRTIDAGATWLQVFRFSTPVTVLDFISSEQGWAVTSQGLFTTNDSGMSWTQVVLPVQQKPSGTVEFVDAQHGWIDNYFTRDGGSTWIEWLSPCVDDWWTAAFSFTSSQDGWMLCVSEPAVGQQGKRVYHSIDGGLKWQLVARASSTEEGGNEHLPIIEYGSEIFFLDDRHGWVGIGRTYTGGQYITDDGGRTWRFVTSNEYGVLSHIQFLTKTRGYALSNPIDYYEERDAIVLLTTEDGGQHWRQIFPDSVPPR